MASSSIPFGHGRHSSDQPFYPLTATTHGHDMEMHNIGPEGHAKVEPMPDAEIVGGEREKRRGCNPIRMLVIIMRSSSRLGACTNILLPFVPVGLVLHWLRPDRHLWIFIANYLAMIPMANLLAFSSAQFARKLPRVLGVIIQLTVASAVEVILCVVLLFKDQYKVIQAALIGSMLANLLLCTGLCFIVGGIRSKMQEFDETVVETGGGLLLVSVAALMLPCAFYESISATPSLTALTAEQMEHKVTDISRFTAILLLIAYAAYLFFQLATHHFLFDRALYQSDLRKAGSEARKRMRENLTISESALVMFVSLGLVTVLAVLMVEQIHWIVESRHVSDAFMGVILVPLVEKAAEHLKGIDEAWDDAMDFALSHLLGSTIQTALLVSPIVVITAWLAHKPFNLNFEIFTVVVLVFAVLVVGNFIKDRKSNYFEGALCVIFYVMIGVCTWYYPNPEESSTVGE